MSAFQVGDRVRSRSGRTTSRVLGVASSGRVLIASEASGRSRMVAASTLRLVPVDHEVGMRCPGCDCEPVGYAPHNGRGDCPPKDVEIRGAGQ